MKGCVTHQLIFTTVRNLFLVSATFLVFDKTYFEVILINIARSIKSSTRITFLPCTFTQQEQIKVTACQ